MAQLCSMSRTAPVLSTSTAGEVALLVLDRSELADAVTERCTGGQPRAHPASDPVGDLATSGREHLLQQRLAADRVDSREETRRQAVVVRGESVLRVGCHVVEMARPADAVADRLAAHERR